MVECREYGEGSFWSQWIFESGCKWSFVLLGGYELEMMSEVWKAWRGSRYFTPGTLLNFGLINNELLELCFLPLKAAVLLTLIPSTVRDEGTLSNLGRSRV